MPKNHLTWEQEVGGRIKRARTDAKIIQKVIAEACGVSIPAVHAWEAGKSPPPAHALVRIAQLTNTDLTWLLTGRPSKSVGFGAVSIAGGGAAVPLIAMRQAHDFENARKNSTSTIVASTPVGPRAFALVIEDRSNADRLQIGDVAVFDPDIRPKPEQFVLALIGRAREPVVRCYEERGSRTVALVPMNKAWKESVIRSPKDGTVVAVLVEVSRSAANI